MTGILDGLTVVEGSAFVAAPLGGMTLAQLGADVIRFDDLSGGLDHTRWPLAAGGQSLFWAGLNKGKRSLRVNLRSEEGRELVAAVIAAAGIFLTNFPARGWLGYETLRARRDDLVMVHLKGNRDGLERGRLHRQPGDGLPVGDGAAQPHRAAELRAAGVGHRHGRARGGRTAGRRPPSHPHGRGAARRGRAL